MKEKQRETHFHLYRILMVFNYIPYPFIYLFIYLSFI